MSSKVKIRVGFICFDVQMTFGEYLTMSALFFCNLANITVHRIIIEW